MTEPGGTRHSGMCRYAIDANKNANTAGRSARQQRSFALI
jgi:hypothetical protein